MKLLNTYTITKNYDIVLLYNNYKANYIETKIKNASKFNKS